MPFYYRKSVGLGRRGTRLNVTKTGVSLSQRVGPVTVNSRGRVTLRLGRGLSWRIR